MALVNTAVTLALRGRRVLAVDFDIEAPGLDTFDVLRPREESPGVIDFVSQYLESGKAPNASRFISECPAIKESGGGLWIMSSGRNETYAANFNQVDWGELYDRHDGYLLFEDLKKQWNRVIEPDYVLIDSRTGHTDTSGICTRQLPDAVVVLFFPNEQNLRGLTEVVSDIRAEADGPLQKNIDLHFVMSNVPDLDDEDRILERKIKAFQEKLNFHREPMVVHRYDSLSLLNQVIFSKDRPRSRLAKEYETIVREISARNWNDRDGALEYIQRAHQHWRWMEDVTIQTREQMLDKIEDAHSDDGEVLFRLAELRESDRQADSASSLINQAIDAGYDQPDAYLKRSRIRADNDDLDGAIEDAWRVLDADQVRPPMVIEAIRLLVRTKSSMLKDIGEATAVRSMDFDNKVWLAMTFNRSLEELPIAISVLEHILGTNDLAAGMRNRGRHFLGLFYMGLGRCSDAAMMFRSEGQDMDELDIVDAFNYGMAIWGVKGRVESAAFERVVELDRSSTEKGGGANYLQCMAISYWVVGDGKSALEYVDRADRAIGLVRSRTIMSSWRYLEVGTKCFRADLENIRSLIKDRGSVIPKFMTKTTNRAGEI